MIQTLPLLLIALCLAPAWTNAAEVDDDELAASAAPPALPAGTGATSLIDLSPERQVLAGIRTAPLEAHALQAEARAYGRVLDIKELLTLRARYRSALSELTIGEAQLKVASKNYERIARLQRESIIPARELIQSEAQLASEQARCEGFRRNLREVREEALQTWGGELFRQAMEHESTLFHALLERSRVLILVTLPPGEPMPHPPGLIKVSPVGDRQLARDAELLSAAPRTDESTQGETWFYVASTSGLRSGMRLDAWLPSGDGLRQGVLIPLTAIVWRDGNPWTFIKTGASTYTRRAIGDHRELGHAWFVEQGFRPGEELVVNGAQSLLSEEMRPQIPSEDGDDD